MTSEQMIDRLYTVVVGIEGEGGMVEDLKSAKESRKNIYKKIEDLEDSVVTKADCADIREKMAEERMAEAKRRRSNWLVVKDIILAICAPGVAALITYLFTRGLPK